jgi:indolepyruvate decarboxylase
MAQPDLTVGGFLLRRLKALGVDHLFGVPGDFVLGFMNQALKSELRLVGACNELNAAYAADGYSRRRGFGAFVTTFGVGELSAINGVAGAYAERVPMVAITGSPATVNFRERPLLHHTLGDYQAPLRMYERVTVASCQLDDPARAPADIDRVLSACLAAQQPGYLSLPADVAMAPCAWPGDFVPPPPPTTDAAALEEALTEAVALLEQANRPVIIGDVELVRFKLQAEFAELLQRSGYPYATLMLGKALLSERHPQFIGLYAGMRSRAEVRERVEGADAVLRLGALMTDFNTGGFTTRLDPSRMVSANIGHVQIRHHHYADVHMRAFIGGLAQRLKRRNAAGMDIRSASGTSLHRSGVAYVAEPGRALTVQRFFDRMSHFIRPGGLVVAETGVSLFSAAEMLLPDDAGFIGQAFYGSIGYTVGAALGACLAEPERQVALFVGDGAFQVTGQELSTMIRERANVVVFLLNNDGYTIERVISDQPYNDLQPWHYHQLPTVYGGEPGFDVRTEGELEAALAASASARGPCFIEVHTGRLDCPDSLRSAGRAMAAINHLEPPGAAAPGAP